MGNQHKCRRCDGRWCAHRSYKLVLPAIQSNFHEFLGLLRLCSGLSACIGFGVFHNRFSRLLSWLWRGTRRNSRGMEFIDESWTKINKFWIHFDDVFENKSHKININSNRSHTLAKPVSDGGFSVFILSRSDRGTWTHTRRWWWLKMLMMPRI